MVNMPLAALSLRTAAICIREEVSMDVLGAELTSEFAGELAGDTGVAIGDAVFSVSAGDAGNALRFSWMAFCMFCVSVTAALAIDSLADSGLGSVCGNAFIIVAALAFSPDPFG
ncbi:hypothetical protein KCQ_04846 [Pectobacterium atrosepticum ICMP 1526]|nr:hypothetical protein KCQ_04846 [Pectobacterium atrosepticum ICMP 1526]